MSKVIERRNQQARNVDVEREERSRYAMFACLWRQTDGRDSASSCYRCAVVTRQRRTLPETGESPDTGGTSRDAGETTAGCWWRRRGRSVCRDGAIDDAERRFNTSAMLSPTTPPAAAAAAWGSSSV